MPKESEHFSANKFLSFKFGISFEKWPPLPGKYQESISFGYRIIIWFLNRGAIGFQIFGQDTSLHFKTPVIRASSSGYFHISLLLTSEAKTIIVNNIRLSTYPLFYGNTNPIDIPVEPIKYQPEIEFARNTPPSATPAEALFIRKVEELVHASKSNDWYTLLNSSAILRHFLLDRFLNTVNKSFRVPLIFEIRSYKNTPLVTNNTIHWKTLTPSGQPGETSESVNLDKFLSFAVLESDQGCITVRDVISAAANADGAIHFGEPRRPEEELILKLDRAHMTMGNAPSRNYLRQISYATARAVMPLIRRIHNKDIQ